MSKYYLLQDQGEIDKRAITYEFSPDREEPYPWPDGHWKPLSGLQYLNLEPGVQKFSDVVAQELPKLYARIRPKVRELPDMIGEWSFVLSSPPPLLRRPLIEMIEAEAPGSCEFLPGPRIWDVTHAREIDGSEYYFTNILARIDSWDEKQTDICLMTRRDGSTWELLNGVGTLNAERVKSGFIWRDSRTKHPLCSEAFKKAAEHVGAVNLHFHPLHTNG